MTEGPLGGAAFGNEFGRPNILGLFVTPHRFPFDHLISWGAEFSRHQGDFYGDSTRAGSGGVGGANPEFVLCLMLQVGNSAFPGEAGAAGKFGPGAPVIGPPAVDLVLPPGNAVVVGVTGRPRSKRPDPLQLVFEREAGGRWEEECPGFRCAPNSPSRPFILNMPLHA